jgi:hypothetical protein
MFMVDVGNKVEPRPDINGSDGFSGIRLVDRAPKGGFNPETTTEATFSAWANYSSGAQNPMIVRVGAIPGNIITMYSPGAQVEKQPYKDLNGTRTTDMQLVFPQINGNDEIQLFFA